ncbi:hypothetical protein Tco_0779728, partial [Tanacetum coccineum]
MSSATSAVTYTSVYTDSEPGRAFWGADDEEISEGGIPRVIVLGYDGLPMQPVAPPSPDYIPGPEDPQTPPVPQDEDEREPMFVQAHDPDYVPEPIYPEYIPLEDEHEFPAEEQPLPPVDSPTAESPGYVTESDPEEDPEEYEDDETEDGPVDYPMDGGDDGDDDDGDSSRDDANDEDEDDEDEEGGAVGGLDLAILTYVPSQSADFGCAIFSAGTKYKGIDDLTSVKLIYDAVKEKKKYLKSLLNTRRKARKGENQSRLPGACRLFDNHAPQLNQTSLKIKTSNPAEWLVPNEKTGLQRSNEHTCGGYMNPLK